jgi:pyridoxamine 5'-phosphate oxidase
MTCTPPDAPTLNCTITCLRLCHTGLSPDGPRREDWNVTEYADLRITYSRSTLNEEDVTPDPLGQFERWFAEAKAVVEEPNAMVCSTVNAAGEVSSRSVLLKAADARGMTFFTNYNSRKGRDIAENPNVSLLFPWYDLHRQVVINGVAERVTREETNAYFASRPHGHRVGSWASPQSEVLPGGREELAHRFADADERYPEGSEVPVPEHWGGYLVRPSSIEFWAGRGNRLHDRLRYRSPFVGAPLDIAWQLERLSP